MFKQKRTRLVKAAGKELAVSGILPRIAKLSGEYHEYLDEVDAFVSQLNNSDSHADIFTFVQPVSDPGPKYHYPRALDSVAVLPVDTYEKWWKEQVNDKTRNMVRKAGKKGVTIQLVEFNEELVKGIERIYNESPLRQGKRFRHYGKDFETLKRAHATYLERSIFIGAFHEEILIGFIKMILLEESASIMQIISMFAHRNKAPTNALLAKAVEICAERGLRFLQYGIWSRRSMGDFKLHNGFKHFEIPRYFVPLNLRGRLTLSLKLHRNPMDLMPGAVLDLFVALRARWFSFKFRAPVQGM
jgi:hypothetical protein